ncbi:AmmeMemoRadiSam system radical SAM enzyme [Corynebacterium sp. 335C]
MTAAPLAPAPGAGVPASDRRTARWWSRDGDRLRCDLCPRRCRLRDGQRGFCFVRAREGDRIVLDTWARSSGFCLDPVEKKPLNHFLPGTAVLSFGTAGCNLGCRFCQNHDISTARDIDAVAQEATPEAIADAAVRAGASAVAATYNDPIIFAEYAIDVARACRARGVRTIAVTAGYIEPAAREEFFGAFDAVNVDLKAFTPEFYRKLTGGRLEVVLDNLRWLATTDIHLEITTLVIPGRNDSDAELRRMCDWVVAELGPETPHHFGAFHPAHRMTDVPATPPETLARARRIALEAGELFPYTGNVHDPEGGTTRCPGCGSAVIVRDWYRLLHWGLDDAGRCGTCGCRVPGTWEARPGTFGPRRIPVRIGR